MAKENNNLRIPPQNLEAERAVLGAILLGEEALNDALEILIKEDFYDKRHEVIFNAIQQLFGERQNVDLVTLTDRLMKSKTLDAAGGASYLTELVEAVASSANASYYCQIVKERSTRRHLINATTQISAKGYEGGIETPELVDEAEQKIFEIASEKRQQKAVFVRESLKEAVTNIDNMRKSGQHITGIQTGFLDLDRITSGFQPSNVIVIGARPAVGKTAFAMALAAYAAVEKKIPVVFFSLEMSLQEITQRLLAKESGVPLGAIRNGYVSNADWPKITSGTARLAQAPFMIQECAGLHPMELRSRVRRLKAKENIGLVIVDYLQLMHIPGRNESRQQEISTISRSIKALAREMKIPIIALSQLSRRADDSTDRKDNTKRAPELSHLRESGAIEQDADLVMLLHRPELEGTTVGNIGVMQVLIRKHRNGPIGDVNLRFHKDLMRFENMAQDGHSGNDD